MEMEAAAALGKYLGAGLACLALAGAGLGIGNVAGSYLSGALRNPSAAKEQIGPFLIGLAFTEALGLFGFVVAMMLLFVV